MECSKADALKWHPCIWRTRMKHLRLEVIKPLHYPPRYWINIYDSKRNLPLMDRGTLDDYPTKEAAFKACEKRARQFLKDRRT